MKQVTITKAVEQARAGAETWANEWRADHRAYDECPGTINVEYQLLQRTQLVRAIAQCSRCGVRVARVFDGH